MLETSVLAEYRSQWEQPSVVLASYHATDAQMLAHQQGRRSGEAHGLRGDGSNNSVAGAAGCQKVEDRLLAYQRAYEAKRISLQHQKDMQHDDGFTGSPGLNHRSKRLAAKRNAGSSVHTRLSAPSAPHRDVPEQEAPPQDQNQTRSEPLDGTPRINKRSSMMARRGVESQFEWTRQKELKRDRMREAQEQRLQAECSAHPEIDDTSRKILRRINTFVDPIQLVLPVEDRLLRHQERIDRELEAKRASQYERQGGTTLTAREGRSRGGASNYRVADVSTRLYQDAEERQRAAEERSRQEELFSFIDEKGELLYHPRVAPGTNTSSAAASRRGEADVFTYLAQERQTQDASVRSEADDAKQLGRPHIGAYSVLLANLTRPSDVSTFERLAAPHAPPSTTSSSSDQRSGHRGDFVPAIDKRSQDIDRQRRGDVRDRVEWLFQRQAAYDAHRERLRREKEAAEAAEIERLEEGRRQKHNANGSMRRQTPDAIYQRMQAWSDRNENRLKGLRESAKIEEVAECTFEPRVTKTPVRATTPRQRTSTPPPTRSTPAIIRHR